MAIVRVATSQYTVGIDISANLNKLLDVIDRAADGGAQLIASPEFANYPSAWNGPEHAWEVALEEDGDWVQAVRRKAADRGIHVVFNATRRGEAFPTVYDTNWLIGPDGEVIGMNNKQVLIGTEVDHITPSPYEGPVFETVLGRVGLYSCMDGVLPETPRVLAVKGAQILVNTLNSMAIDEPSMHIPIRATENRVWVISANKVGPIIPEAAIKALATARGIPEHILYCQGETQIISPTGEIVAQGRTAVEDIVFADIDPSLADDKTWADGDLMADRRPDAYRILVTPEEQPDMTAPVAAAFESAIIQVRHDRGLQLNLSRAFDLAAEAATNGAQLIVFPELFAWDLAAVARDPQAAAREGSDVLDRLRDFAREQGVWVATSLPLEREGTLRHSGVLIDSSGAIVHWQDQVHLPRSIKRWARPGDGFSVVETPLGRIGMMVGYDGLFPETASVLAKLGADVIVYPTAWQFEWEVRYGMPERAAENRVSIIAAARWDSPAKRGGIVIPLDMSPAILRGDLNPVWPREAMRDRESYTPVRIDPAPSRHKTTISKVDLLKSRQTHLYQALVAEPALVRR